MKVYRVDKACSTAKLHGELVAAGVPCTTVRGAHAKAGEPAMYAVVVAGDGASDAKVAQVVAAHQADGTPTGAQTAGEKEAAFKEMERV